MAKYSDIKGFTVQTLSTDTIASQIAGGSWSAGGNLPGPRDETTGGGTLTAGIQFGGYSPPESAYKPETFEYNGTAWTEGGDMSNARSNFGGLGTQTAALAVGGQNPGLSPYPFNGSEEYNGSSWTTGGTLPGGFDGNYGCTGTQTAGLQIGGTLNPNTKQVKTLSYNGTSWSDTGHDVPTALDRNGATGTSTAAMTGGGRAPSATNAFNIYNGSSWTSITNYPQSGYHFQLQGPYTDVIASGGYPLNTNANWWDGSSWTTAPSLSNNHGQSAHANSTAGATSGDGFVAGADPSGFNGTEHWNSAPSTFNQITQGQLFFNSTANAFKETILDTAGGTWASGGNIPAAKFYGGQGGTNTAGIIFGGYQPSPGSYSTETFEYNGTAWTDASGDINTGREGCGSAGTQASALYFGGTPGKTAITESWDGSSWTEVSDLNTGRDNLFGLGVLGTQALATGGRAAPSPDAVAVTEQWNGSSWTEVGDLNQTRKWGGSCGTYTAGAIAGGGDSGEGLPVTGKTETWDGSSWTETGDLNEGRDYAAGSGSPTSFLFWGGYYPPGSPPAHRATTELFNGTSWTEINDMAQARAYLFAGANGAPSTAVHAVAGQGSPGTTNYAVTEEFEASLANKTITTS